MALLHNNGLKDKNIKITIQPISSPGFKQELKVNQVETTIEADVQEKVK